MSASAVAARAVSLSISSSMDEEEQEPRQQKCEELDDEHQRQHSPSLDLGSRKHQQHKILVKKESTEKEEEERMVLEEPAQESEVDVQLRAMAVSATERTTPTVPRTNAAARAQHDAAPSTATSTGTRSAGESHDDVNGKDRLKPFIRTCQKFESGSGSGDQDGMVSMEDGIDVAAKKRKTRRGKPKHRKLKPYSKQQPTSYQQRRGSSRPNNRPNKAGRNNPPAPYNTTQFLMEDHNELPDLDEKIAGAALASSNSGPDLVCGIGHFSKPIAPSRTRDSSFSIDSDEEYFYSSPEDEEEFLSKEFSNAYEETHAERLSALSKAQLINEYIQLEAKVDGLTKRLRAKNNSAVAAAEPIESIKNVELAKKLKAVQQRVEELQQQNEQLRRENEMLRKRHGSPMSSVDSESDSESSCSSQSHAGSECSGSNQKTTSPGSSPVPASYHACREKSSRHKSSSVSSVASETDSTTNDSSCPGIVVVPKSAATTTPSNSTTAANGAIDGVANGHATSYEIVGLPI